MRGRERRQAVYRETFPISDKSVPATLWAPRGQGLAPVTGLLRAERIGVGKLVPASFILAQLEETRNSAPASIMLIPTCVGADIGVSTATPKGNGRKAEKDSRRSWVPTCQNGSLEARTGPCHTGWACAAAPKLSQRWEEATVPPPPCHLGFLTPPSPGRRHSPHRGRKPA